MTSDDMIAVIKEAVHQVAQQMRDAGYGTQHDNGASMAERHLSAWLDGVQFARTGKTLMYDHFLTAYAREQDPEYQEYLRLQEKFK